MDGWWYSWRRESGGRSLHCSVPLNQTPVRVRSHQSSECVTGESNCRLVRPAINEFFVRCSLLSDGTMDYPENAVG